MAAAAAIGKECGDVMLSIFSVSFHFCLRHTFDVYTSIDL